MSSLASVTKRLLEREASTYHSNALKVLAKCKEEEARWETKIVPHPILQNTWIVKKLRLKDGKKV